MSFESVMPSNHLILCCPHLLLPSFFPSIRVFSNEFVLLIRWPEYGSLSFSISPSNEYLGLISFRIDWCELLAVSRVFSSTTIQKHQFFGVQPSLWSQPSHPLRTTGKTIVLTIRISVSRVMSLFCLSRFVIALLPRTHSKRYCFNQDEE